MVDIVLYEQFSYGEINEMRTFITDKGSRCLKSRENVL